MFTAHEWIRRLPLAALILSAGAIAAAMKPVAHKYPNPLLALDTPDPAVVRDGDKLYMYCTGTLPGKGSYPIYVSDYESRTSWTFHGTVLTEEFGYPAWASQSRFSYWAPEVHLVGRQYICYFSTRDPGNKFHIGTATSKTPGGPFLPQPTPIASADGHGLIDASYYLDPQTRKSYLLYKEDKNDLNPPEPTGILIQELTNDGLTTVGKASTILINDQPWEDVLVEGPSIVFRNGYYYLFYSGNVFSVDAYAVGVARSRNLLGPYEKFANNPIMKSSSRFSGPGHQFLYEEQPGNWTMFYHARDNNIRGRRHHSRLLLSDPVRWRADGWPFIENGIPSLGWNGW